MLTEKNIDTTRGSMATCSVVILFCCTLLITSSAGAQAQRFQWDNVHAGFAAHWMVPQGDLGTYWMKTLAAGPTLSYTIDDRYAAVGIIGLMYFKKTPGIREPAVPDIFLITATGELQRTLFTTDEVRGGVRVGLGNYRFMFRINEFNNTESEFGAVGSFAIEIPHRPGHTAALLVQYHIIFASPVWIRVWAIGGSLYFF
jgi:hypothetical protein